MRMRTGFVALAAAVSLSTIAAAGGSHGHKCTKGTQECLDAITSSYSSKGWAGIELEKSSGAAYVVQAVVEGSPAAAAGFRAGDVLVALNGVRFSEDNKEALAKVKKTLAVGSIATYTIQRAGAEQKIAVKLAPVPSQVLAGWVGEHMIEHATPTRAADSK